MPGFYPEGEYDLAGFCVGVVDKEKILENSSVSAGDVIAICEKSRGSEKIKEVLEKTESRIIPKWLDLDRNTLSGKVLALAQRDDIDLEIAEHLIVELYSKN